MIPRDSCYQYTHLFRSIEDKKVVDICTCTPIIINNHFFSVRKKFNYHELNQGNDEPRDLLIPHIIPISLHVTFLISHVYKSFT